MESSHILETLRANPRNSIMEFHHPSTSSDYFRLITERNTIPNWWNVLTTYKKVIAGVLVFILVLAGFVLLLGFLVRCDGSKFIKHYETQIATGDRLYAEFSESWKARVKDQEEKYKLKKIEWVHITQFREDTFEASGNERYHGGNVLLYVARTPYLNGMAVGKYCPHIRRMFFGSAGKEQEGFDFEILSFPRGTLSWALKEKGGTLPPETTFVFGGAAPTTGKNTYICRLKYDGHIVIGKFFADGRSCVAVYGPIERTNETFEILVINALGRMLGVDS